MFFCFQENCSLEQLKGFKTSYFDFTLLGSTQTWSGRHQFWLLTNFVLNWATTTTTVRVPSRDSLLTQRFLILRQLALFCDFSAFWTARGKNAKSYNVAGWLNSWVFKDKHLHLFQCNSKITWHKYLLSTVRNGTCYTSSECSSKGGTASGNCAAG